MAEIIDDRIRDLSAGRPDAVAIRFEERSLSWAKLDGSVDILARRLLALKHPQGSVIAVMAENSPEFLISVFAIWRAGHVVAVIFPSFGAMELDYALANSQPVLVFVEPRRRETLDAAIVRSGRSIAISSLASGILPLDDVEPVDVALPAIDPEAVAIISYTSGTSGTPKPVAHRHGMICAGAQRYARTWHIGTDDVILVAMPLAWMAGLFTLSLTGIAGGATIVIMRRFDPVESLRVMKQHGVTFFFGATTMYVKILGALQDGGDAEGLKLRCCVSGGEPRNEAMFDLWRRVTGAGVLDCYASTEFWPMATYDPTIDPVPRNGAAGMLLEGVEMRLLDPEGREVPAGETGEAYFKTEAQMHSYWQEPELTAKAVTEDGWYRTGDYLRLDEAGYLHFVGRASDLIIRGGTNISPSEIESVLSEFPGVGEVAAVGLPDPVYGQVVAVAVVPAAGHNLDADELKQHCITRMARFKVPDVIVFLDGLPHNASGKVVRRQVVPILEELRI